MANELTARPRQHYFDVLKGIAIFLVVMGHVLGICIRGIDRASVFKIIGEVHMPMFFFISGWLAMRTDSAGNIRSTALWPKAKRLLLPMIVVSLLWVWYYPLSGLESPFTNNWFELLASEWKYGYWFTPVLFVIFVLYAVVSRLFTSRPSAVREGLLVLCVWIAMLVIDFLLPADIRSWLSWSLITRFFPVFMAGALAHRHSRAFFALCETPGIVAAAILTFAVTMSYVGWPWRYPDWLGHFDMVFHILLQLSVAVVGIAVVRPWSERAFSPEAAPGTHRVARMWDLIGRKSLSIYLLHYFFLFPMGCIRPSLEAMDLAKTPLIALSAVVAAVIVGLVLIVDYILSFAAPLDLLLTGTTNKKK